MPRVSHPVCHEIHAILQSKAVASAAGITTTEPTPPDEPFVSCLPPESNLVYAKVGEGISVEVVERRTLVESGLPKWNMQPGKTETRPRICDGRSGEIGRTLSCTCWKDTPPLRSAQILRPLLWLAKDSVWSIEPQPAWLSQIPHSQVLGNARGLTSQHSDQRRRLEPPA